MIKNGRIYPGTPFRVTLTLQDEDGNLIDPDTVTLKTYNPCGQESSYVYGTDSEIQRDSIGYYLGDITPTIAGQWRFRWETTGTGEATVIEDGFNVISSPFAPYNSNTVPDYT